MLENSKSFQTLQVYLAPSGSQDNEFEYLKEEAENWVDKIRTSYRQD